MFRCKSILFVTLVLTLHFAGSGQTADMGALQKFRAEAPSHLARLQAIEERLEVTARITFKGETSDNVFDLLLRGRPDCLAMERTERKQRQVVRTAFVVNPDYQFEVKQETEARDDNWRLVSVGRGDDAASAKVKALRIYQLTAYIHPATSFQTAAPRMLSELLNDPQFFVENAEWEGACVRLRIRYSEDVPHLPKGMIRGTILLDPQMGWAVRSYESRRGDRVFSVANEFAEESIDGYRRVARSRVSIRSTGQKDSKVLYEFLSARLVELALDAFRLTTKIPVVSALQAEKKIGWGDRIPRAAPARPACPGLSCFRPSACRMPGDTWE
jgi:hypothetical protein